MSRATFFRLHSWLGIVTGAFVLVIAWSGSVAVFKEEIDWLLTPAVRADPARGVRPLDEIVAAVRARYPDGRVAVNLPVGARWAYTARADGTPFTRYLYLDPATATIRQDEAMRGYTWNASYFLRQLHVRLLMGVWGRVFVGLCGVALVLLVITSFWIYRDWIRSLFRVRRLAGRRVFHSDLHKAVGLWALVFNAMFGVTGAILGIENLYTQVQRASAARAQARAKADAAAATPRVAPAAARAAVAGLQLPAHLTPGGVVDALAAADREFQPGVIELPARGRTVVVRGDHPGALIAKNVSAYTVDLDTGRVSAAIDARRASLGTYLYNTLEPMHFGYFGDKSGSTISYAIKIVWCLAGLTPGVLSITGGYMWLLRRRRSQAAAAARRAPPLAVPATTPSRWPARGAYAAGLAGFLLVGYWMQASLWQRGWPLTEVLWEHWIVKPFCLVIVCFPLTLAALWLGHAGMRVASGSGARARRLAFDVVFGLLGALPVGFLYLAATAVLN